MNQNPRKQKPVQIRVTSYMDFMKSLKSSKGSTSAVTPKVIKESKENSICDVNKIKPKGLRIPEELRQTLTSRPKSFGKQQRATLTSRINTEASALTTRFQTEFQSVFTQNNSCSKSKSKSHFDSENTFTKESEYKRSTEAKIIVFYINEILLVLQQLPRINCMKIAYLDYLQLLRLLNMIQSNYEPSKNDHVYKFWSVISTKQSTINIINFSILFLGCMNVLASSKIVIQQIQSCKNIEIPSLKFKKVKSNLQRVDKLGYLLLNKAEVKEIYHQFKQFRTTRMFLGRIQKKGEIIEHKLQQYSNHKFHPTISNKSIQLAKIRKEKQSHKVSINEELLESHRNKYEDQIKKDILSPRQKHKGMKRSQILYNLCKSRSKEKRDRSQDEVEYERNQKLYTFKPEIVHKIKLRKTIQKKSMGNVSGETKILQRFLKGRVQKQLKRKSLQMGSTYNSKSIERLRKKITEQFVEKSLVRCSQPIHITPPNRQPAKQYLQPIIISPQPQILKCQDLEVLTNSRRQIFNFEVYLQGGVFVDVIRVYEGDCVQSIASQFIQKHKLKADMQMKLLNSIRANLQNINDKKLEEIEQESVECSFDF